ncbi:MAG: site-specific integrase [Thermoplasmatales archaeon]|nr:MAG: site-specific integrase [Thermoplasmatales archaeon]
MKDKEKRTRINYGWILRQYFREIKQIPETYFKKKRDYQSDVDKWWRQHLDEVPKTRNTKLAIVRGLLEDNDVVFGKKYWLKLRKKRKGSRAATLDRVPTQSEFKTMLMHGDVKDKSLFLFTMSSGMRIDEVLKLKITMVDLKHDPPMVKIPGNITKNGDPRTTFISQEAKAYLEEWLKIRKSYIRTAIKKTGHITKKDVNDDTLFPFSYDVAWTSWNRLLRKAKLDDKDPTTNRYVLHIHCLRKYFLSQMKLSIPAVIPEALAGHEQYLDEAYQRYTIEQLGEYYKRGEQKITILESLPDLTGVHELLKEKDHQIQKQSEEIQDLRNQMQKLMVEVLTMKDKEKK